MLSDSLNTNEVKDSAGTEVEMTRLSINDRETVFAKVGETPSLPLRLTIKHSENGSGLKKRRRSVVRVDKTTISGVDSETPITHSAYVVYDSPVGAMSSNAEGAHVLAHLTSFMASTGASTTILYDGTGNGSVVCLAGSL